MVLGGLFLCELAWHSGPLDAAHALHSSPAQDAPGAPGDRLAPDLRVPDYVRACVENRWTMGCFNAAGDFTRFPYKCGSRRCPDCRKHWGRQVHARIAAALQGEGIDNCSFMVLTLDKLGRHGGKRFSCKEDAMRNLPWPKMLRRLRRLCGQHGEKMHFVSTVEVHEDGWPHLNVILVSKVLASKARENEIFCNMHDLKVRDCPPGWLVNMAIKAGFGPRAYIETPKESKAKLAGYIVKVAKGDGEFESDGMGNVRMLGEVTKGTQAPVEAPPNFRTLRSSKGLLPPKARGKGDCIVALIDENGNQIAKRALGEAGYFTALLGERRPATNSDPIYDFVEGRIYANWHLAASGLAPGRPSRVYRLKTHQRTAAATQTDIPGIVAPPSIGAG